MPTPVPLNSEYFVYLSAVWKMQIEYTEVQCYLRAVLVGDMVCYVKPFFLSSAYAASESAGFISLMT